MDAQRIARIGQKLVRQPISSVNSIILTEIKTNKKYLETTYYYFECNLYNVNKTSQIQTVQPRRFYYKFKHTMCEKIFSSAYNFVRTNRNTKFYHFQLSITRPQYQKKYLTYTTFEAWKNWTVTNDLNFCLISIAVLKRRIHQRPTFAFYLYRLQI